MSQEPENIPDAYDFIAQEWADEWKAKIDKQVRKIVQNVDKSVVNMEKKQAAMSTNYAARIADGTQLNAFRTRVTAQDFPTELAAIMEKYKTATVPAHVLLKVKNSAKLGDHIRSKIVSIVEDFGVATGEINYLANTPVSIQKVYVNIAFNQLIKGSTLDTTTIQLAARFRAGITDASIYGFLINA